MAKKHTILRGIGILFVGMLVVFSGVFFYAYVTGGDPKVLSMFSGEGVGVLQIDGAIDDSRGVVDELKRLKAMPWVRAIVVRIDSPGGAVAPTQEIFEEIQRSKKSKPFIASMGGMATSGGYYIAAACDRIVANPGTLTGSIGVIMQLTNVEELMKKIGVKGVNVKSGPNKDIGSPLLPLSPEGREILQSLVDNVHSQFVAAVAKGRGIDEMRVRKLADGRIYSGAQPKISVWSISSARWKMPSNWRPSAAALPASRRFIFRAPSKSAGGNGCSWAYSAGACRGRSAAGCAMNGRRRCSTEGWDLTSFVLKT
jgi:protease-4